MNNNYLFKDRFRISIILYCSLVIVSGCSLLKQKTSCVINREQWQLSSDYRYRISKTDTFDIALKNKTPKQIIKILGTPDDYKGNDYKNDFVYCFDVNPKSNKHSDEKGKCCACKSSFVVINFKDGKMIDLTFVLVD
ncbi:MAG TPA: hypothetical protein VNG53_04585 [Bacteroidia bacterium]|nr:hypothetical protein [Bacteroidia bacterium]